MPSISKYHAAEPRHTLSHLSSEAPQLSFGYGAGGAATVLQDRSGRPPYPQQELGRADRYLRDENKTTPRVDYCSLDKGVAYTKGGGGSCKYKTCLPRFRFHALPSNHRGF